MRQNVKYVLKFVKTMFGKKARLNFTHGQKTIIEKERRTFKILPARLESQTWTLLSESPRASWNQERSPTRGTTKIFNSKALTIFYCVCTYLVHHEVGQVWVVVVELV